MTNLFGMADIPAYYQPVKTIARHRLAGDDGRSWGPFDGKKVLFAKEMAGPYVHYEALFNPIDILIKAGWPISQLHLLILDRDPQASLSSWFNKWETRIGRQRVLDNFLLSSLNYARIRSYADRVSVGVTHFPYEASRLPELAVEKLFDAIGIGHHFSPSILTGWGDSGDLNSNQSRVINPDEPEPYIVPGLHGTGDSYRYQHRAADDLTGPEIEVARSLQASYDISVERCATELNLQPEELQAIIGHR